ncbi:MAG: M14 family zinc carboxypeptidase [Gemmatimonadota bacterium]
MAPLRRFLSALACVLVSAGPSLAQQSVLETRDPGQAQDADFARAIAEWTTQPEFMSPLVDHLPTVEGVPSPKDVLGYHIGAPKKLTYYADILRYYRALEAASPRVKVISTGTTDEGRETVVVFVSSEQTMANLDRYREALAHLADPRGLSAEEAKAVIAEAKPIYHVMGGLHSGETGPPEMEMELAYRLATETSPLIQGIRDNVITSFTPVADPDGRDRYVDWYYRYLVDIDNEDDRMSGPPYWGKYVLHDNNRDINYSQVTMRTLLDWYLEWHPPIMHELHESIPFMYNYSGQDPQNPAFDPILFGELPWYANYEMAQMIKYGMPGVWTHGFMDAWSPGYLGAMSYNHNGLMRMYETFGNGGATTMERDLSGGGGRQVTREWYRPLPPYEKVVWSMRNNTNYMQTGVLLGLQLTSQFPKVVLENFYLKTLHSIEDGENKTPHGFVLPAGQRDMTRVALLVNLLRTQGIEVGQARRAFQIGETTYPASSYVIKRNQPYGRLANLLLQRQDNYPDESLQTYDDSGWTMGLMLQTEVVAVDDQAILEVQTAPVDAVRLAGSITGRRSPALYAVPHLGSTNMITLRYRLADLGVQALDEAFAAEGVELPAGSFLIPAAGADERIRAAIEELGLTAVGLSSAPDVATHELDLPRIAMYSTWSSTQDVGWVRYSFDQFQIPYDLIYKERVRQGHLKRDYDVIVMPSQGRDGKSFVQGLEPRDRPVAYTQTPEFKSLGMYGSSDDITGGMGLEGVLEFERFLSEGGVLMTLGNATTFPTDMGLVRDINSSRPGGNFYAPRPIVEAQVTQPENPIFYGYTESTLPIKYTNGPLLQVPDDEQDDVMLMKFVGGKDAVLSGLMRGPDQIRNRPAIVSVPAGSGRLLMYATNPVYRWQNHGEFNMLFNALLNYNDLERRAKHPVTEDAAAGTGAAHP